MELLHIKMRYGCGCFLKYAKDLVTEHGTIPLDEMQRFVHRLCIEPDLAEEGTDEEVDPEATADVTDVGVGASATEAQHADREERKEIVAYVENKENHNVDPKPKA